jgi:DedD protein
VTESREPSYYEIALTNRQVVVAFVILLVCLLSAFFSGVWIGRESTARAQEQIASSTPPAEKKEGQSVEELEFFDARKDAGTGKSQDARPQRDETPAPAAPSANSTTLAQDLGNEPEPSPKPEPPAPPAAAVVPTPVPVAPTPEPGRGRRGRGRNRDRLAEAGETPAAPGSTRPGKASQVAETAIPKGSSVIQVFSSQDRSQAEAIQKRLVKGGQKAYLSPVDVAGHTMYRVRIGPFSSRPDAQKVAEKVRKTYKLDTWVTE